MTNLTLSKLKMFQNWVHKCQKRMPWLRKGQWKKKKRKRKVLDCGKKSLLSGNLNRHRGSKNCISKKLLKQKSENLKSILADPDSSSSAIDIALKKVPKQISEQRQQDLALELKGSTQRPGMSLSAGCRRNSPAEKGAIARLKNNTWRLLSSTVSVDWYQAISFKKVSNRKINTLSYY